MLISVFNYIKNIFFHPLTQTILRIFSILSMVTTIITIGGLVFYTIGYSFLYGYYFSGSMDSSISLIDLLINNIPFPTYSVIITSIAFTLAIILFIFILYSLNLGIKQLMRKGERENGIVRVLVTLIGSFIFHMGLTTFFVGDFSSPSNTFIKFSFIWIGPFLLAISIYFFTRYMKGIFSTLSGFLYGIIGMAFLTVFVDNPPELSILLIFIVALVLSYFEHLIRFFWYRSILFFPAIFILFLVFLQFIPSWKPSRIIIFSITIVISIVLGCFIGRKKHTTSNDLKQIQLKNKTNQPKFGSLAILLTIVFLSFLATTIPFLAQKTGIYFRESTPSKTRQTIVYDNNNYIDNATLVAERENLYYISSKDWNLIILKTEFLKVEETLSSHFPQNSLPQPAQ